jgi:alpha-L-rhamnosidase
MATWSFRGNACDVPTDCPHRERAAWTGDWQVFVPAAAFLYDVAGFSLKWLRDLAAEQLDDGCILNFAPDPGRKRGLAGADVGWRFLSGSSGWADAIVMVPWQLWRAYGDLDLLGEFWPAIVRWLDYAAEMARTQRFHARSTARPEPLPHEHILWDTGFHWGEWLEPGAPDVPPWADDPGPVATAFLSRSAELASRIAGLLGNDTDEVRFGELAAGARDAWSREFIADDGSLTPSTQATYVRALAFGLVPEEFRAEIADHLVRMIRDAGMHLGTGFLATPYLLQVLADTGHLDVAYDVLLQRTPPSWLAMVDAGATTMWEAWDGMLETGVPKASLNHYSKGAVIEFLHGYVAGIELLDEYPGYQRFRIRPRPGGGITWAEGVHDSPYGRIESSWRVDGGELALTVTIPPGTHAEVVLPDGTVASAEPGMSVHRCSFA